MCQNEMDVLSLEPAGRNILKSPVLKSGEGEGEAGDFAVQFWTP